MAAVKEHFAPALPQVVQNKKYQKQIFKIIFEKYQETAALSKKMIYFLYVFYTEIL